MKTKEFSQHLTSGLCPATTESDQKATSFTLPGAGVEDRRTGLLLSALRDVARLAGGGTFTHSPLPLDLSYPEVCILSSYCNICN